ncbi:uncharacterized protein N7446_012725 [Penicillium canescens]|uniref:DUF7702 domain-containing protein n=1 Tax=Penicillium canescens TaxID=5083 RepID=A0AAD6HXP2_PENCN|nr:uncharacterized protein N7446_012725 [Penicillium canescens]KAJ6022372.1 hypothetical protein N7460_012767 [Penicillium canescens]KAJ6026369.1 hypothetical protein N7444_014048 [Penicillium canescens]KAJ6041659.1 hypothetical protein N7446_012725 [Penicillium canescens]
MAVTYHNGISIFQLIIYLPAFFLSSILVFRHGLRRSSGFFFLNVFAQARIVGICCDLATITNQLAMGLYVGAAVCSSIGLSPLLLACTGLLSRANLSIGNTTGRRPLPHFVFYFFHALTITCLALTVAGITADMSPQAMQNPDIKIKVGVILYIISWAVMCLFLAILAWHRGSLEKGEHRTLVAVAISTPFLLVRIHYSVFMWFSHNPDFSLFNGNVTVQLVMSVLEEVVVVVVCLAIGMTLRVRGKTSSREEEAGASDHLLASYAPKP